MTPRAELSRVLMSCGVLRRGLDPDDAGNPLHFVYPMGCYALSIVADRVIRPLFVYFGGSKQGTLGQVTNRCPRAAVALCVPRVLQWLPTHQRAVPRPPRLPTHQRAVPRNSRCERLDSNAS